MVLLLILIALIVAVLAIPFDVTFSVQRKEAFKSKVAISWLFGIVQFTVPSGGEQIADKKPPKKLKEKKAGKKSKNEHAFKQLLWNARFRYRLLKFIKDVLKSIHIASFYMRIRLGLDDPADTGRLWAYFGPLAVFLSNLSHATIQLEPDFQEEIIYLDSCGGLRIVPLQVVFTVLAFLFSPITIGALWAMSQSGKR